MYVKAKLKSYEEQEFSITLTAPVSGWRAAMKQLDGTPYAGDFKEGPQ